MKKSLMIQSLLAVATMGMAPSAPAAPRRVYGCHNRPRPTAATSHIGQAGWSGTFRDGFGNPCHTPIYVDIKHVMSTDCQYDKSQTDAGCAGCCHQKGAMG